MTEQRGPWKEGEPRQDGFAGSEKLKPRPAKPKPEAQPSKSEQGTPDHNAPKQ